MACGEGTGGSHVHPTYDCELLSPGAAAALAAGHFISSPAAAAWSPNGAAVCSSPWNKTIP